MRRDDDKKSFLIGAGLAFSLGWLWFPWLGELWLPGVIWGSAGSGGGLAFLLILVLGYLFGGVFCQRLTVPREGEAAFLPFLRRHCRRFCHSACYILLVFAVLLHLYGPKILPADWPYLALPAAAAAYLVCGLYWGARLVRLPQAAAPTAFFFAAALGVLIGRAAAFLPPEIQLPLWPQGQLVAWVMAEMLERRERAKTRVRGRPRKTKAESESSPFELRGENRDSRAEGPGYRLGLAFALAALACAAGSAWRLADAQRFPPPAWAAGLCFCLGAFVPAFAARSRFAPLWRELTANAAAVFFTFLAVSHTVLFMIGGVDFPALAEGAVSGLALAALAGAEWKNGAAARAAGMIACVSVLALNGGWLFGEAAGGAAGTAAAGVLSLTAAFLLLRRPVFRLWLDVGSREGGDGENAARAEDDGTEPAGEPFFTREEAQILTLLARQELSNQAIADALFISRATIRYHLRKMYVKTNTSSREELLRFAAAHGKETPEDA